MRLDAPQSGTVREIILASLKAEADGLKGRVVIDSRGLPAADKNGKPDVYGQYDQTLRNLAELVQTKTKLSSVFDDRPEVLAAGSVKDVAIYMGWYSVDQVRPRLPVQARRGRVPSGQLHDADPAQGRSARLGAQVCSTTASPPPSGRWPSRTCRRFPTPMSFFPLLLTGKLTLAEVYWKTIPWPVG